VSARFLNGGRQVLVAGQALVRRWNPDGGERQILATRREGETFLAADVLGEDVVSTQSPSASAPSAARVNQRRSARATPR
jgi:hypothetical protein